MSNNKFDSSKKLFKGRNLLIATRHRKENVIAPLLERSLGVKCFVAENFDTDVLGTFTGEIERSEDPITTARKKCLMAMELYNIDLAIASEGSFGMHPFNLFSYADEEIVLLIDRRNALEIVAKELSADTNFDGEDIKSETQLKDFAKRVGFPKHGLIIRGSKDDFTQIVKGITDWNKLEITFREFVKTMGTVFVETDMRAMYNPTRMLVIRKATKKLIAKIKSHCPQCNTPGFGVTGRKEGLPCSLCYFETRSTLSYLYTCNKCYFTKEEMYPNKITKEDPMYCDRCNP